MQVSLKKDYVKYVSLNILGMIGISCYILADTYFIAQALGSKGIAALNLSIPIYSLIHGVGLMIGIGGATRFAIVRAQRELKEAHHVYSQAILFASFVGFIFLLIGIFLSSHLAKWVGADRETITETSTYLRTILMFSPFFILNNTMQAFVRNDGNPSLAMKAMLIGSFVNIVLDYIFVFPLNMGMFGAALATSISPIVGLFLLSFHKKNIFHQLQFKWEKLNVLTVIDFSYLGASGLINEVSGAVVMFTFNTVIFHLEGNEGLAAYGIVANISFVILSLFVGVSQGSQPLLSESFGMKEEKRLKQLLSLSLLTSLMIAAFVYLLTFFLAEPIALTFNSEEISNITEMAVTGLRVYFAGFFFAGMNSIFISYFGAVALPRSSLFFSMTRGGIILIPLVLLFSQFFKMTGVWFSYVIAEAVVSLWIFIHITVKKKREKKLH